MTRFVGFFIFTPLIFIVTILCGILYDRYQLNNFECVYTGMLRQDVFRQLGTPRWRITKLGCQWKFVDYKDGCTEILVYPSIFAPLTPRYKVIWLNSKGQTLKTFIYDSP
jgi:hypothetical protein